MRLLVPVGTSKRLSRWLLFTVWSVFCGPVSRETSLEMTSGYTIVAASVRCSLRRLGMDRDSTAVQHRLRTEQTQYEYKTNAGLTQKMREPDTKLTQDLCELNAGLTQDIGSPTRSQRDPNAIRTQNKRRLNKDSPQLSHKQEQTRRGHNTHLIHHHNGRYNLHLVRRHLTCSQHEDSPSHNRAQDNISRY